MAKYDELFCFCITRPDLDAILGKVLDEQRYLQDIEGPLDDGSRRLVWKRNAPAIEVFDESGKPAQVRIDIARADLEDVVGSNPHAWFAKSSAVDELRHRLKQATRVVRFRSPDVGLGWRGPFRICRSLAGKIRFATAGVVMLDDTTFETPAGELIRPS